MTPIAVFSDEEKKAIAQVEDLLNQKNGQEQLSHLHIQRMAITELSKAISLHPSILKDMDLQQRNFENLMNLLLDSDYSDMIFRLPTKAVIGKSFSLAKINFFSSARYMAQNHSMSSQLLDELHGIISKKVFTMMVEEILQDILSDKAVAQHVRTNAGYFLMNIWDYRIDYGVRDFAPLMSNLWRARESLNPAFGTLLGMSELFSLAKNWDMVLLEFIQKDKITEYELISISEFLFDLTYEQMQLVEAYMRDHQKKTISKKDIIVLFGRQDHFPEGDPRFFYRSYRQRKIAAANRIKSGSSGPQKSFEEYITIFLLTRPEQWLNE